jgi:hypothetical protein
MPIRATLAPYEAHLAPARAWLEQAGIACD